jgi:hypothetical protein
MKKVFLLVVISIFTLGSCSNSNEEENDSSIAEVGPLLKKITNNGDFTGTYTYDGAKVIKYTDSKYNTGTITYKYSNNLITEISTNSNIYNYSYENNKLAYTDQQSYQGEGSGYKKMGRTVYTYPSAFQIVGKYYQYNQNNVLSTSHSETILYTINNSGNISRIDTVGEPGTLGSYVNYEYDNKNNCFKNVLGFDKLLDPEMSSKNNILKTVSRQTSYNEIIKIYVYNYNDKGYPTDKGQSYSGSGVGNSFTLIY